MRLLRNRLKPFALFLVLAASGCALLRFGLGNPLRFSHKLHLEQGLECQNCHSKTDKGTEAGMPGLKQCMRCHEGLDEEKAPERKVTTLFEDGKFKGAGVTEVGEDVIFSHRTHTADEKVACTECHTGIEESAAITKAVRVTMDDCMACHAKRGVPNDCATCHQTIRQDVPPASHRQNWKRFHGQKAKDGDMKGVNRCETCHTEDSCNACHQTEAPASHTQFWRERGHGVAVSIDRNACQVCHLADACEHCHQQTSPRSHRGQWGEPVDKHCLSCHFPVANERCGTCHQDGTPSHATASPMPAVPAHNAGMNCRQCHGGAQRLPHADNGDSCTLCHH